MNHIPSWRLHLLVLLLLEWLSTLIGRLAAVQRPAPRNHSGIVP